MKRTFMVVIIAVIAATSWACQMAKAEDWMTVINTPSIQIERWRETVKEWRGFGISEEEFSAIPSAPVLTEQDKVDGYFGVALFYGFGNDGRGNSDVVLSGEFSWDIVKMVHKNSSISDCVLFEEGWLRLNPEVRPRPKGFFWYKLRFVTNLPPASEGRDIDVTRKVIPEGDTGASFEALQLVGVLIPELAQGQHDFILDMPDYKIALGKENNFIGDSLTLAVINEKSPKRIWILENLFLDRNPDGNRISYISLR